MLQRKTLRRLSIFILCMFIFLLLLSAWSPKKTNKKTPPVSNTNNLQTMYISPIRHMLINNPSLFEPYIEKEGTDDLKNEDNINNEETVEDIPEETESTEPEVPELPYNYCSWGDFTLTDYEFKLLCTTVYCEAGNQPIETQIMVCLTVLNRYDAGWGSTLRSIIYAPNAYEVTEWSNFENRGWTPQVEEAVKIALKTNEHPRDMFYFRTNHFHKGEWAKEYMVSGDLYFSVRN